MKSHGRLECFRRDPIGFAGGDVNLYRYVGNQPSDGSDPSGTGFWDYILKLNNQHIYSAIGMQSGGIAQLELPWLPIPSKAGAATGVYFFPDSCEIGVFSIKAGIVKLLDPNGGPLKIDWEGGFQLGGTLEFERALFTGLGTANADSFKGIFYTVEVSVGDGPSLGVSGYRGKPDANGRYWFGGTFIAGVGVPGPPLTGGSTAYNYQLIKSFQLNRCVCLTLIYSM